MAWLKGPRGKDNYVIINDKVRFKKAVRIDNYWGTERFVDGVNGVAGRDGRSPATSLATIQTGVTAATGGDVVYINPLAFHEDRGWNRYTEDVVITSGIASNLFANAGISLIGITRPGATGDFLGVRWTHATATALTNDAPALSVENIGFFSEGATYGVHLVHDGATNTKQGSQGTSFYNCAFKGQGLYVKDGGDGLTVEKCRFQPKWDGTVCQLNYSASANPGRRLTVRNCEWLDGNGTANSGPMIYLLAPITEVVIRDCFFPQIPTGNTYITAAGAIEGIVANIHCAAADLVIATHFAVSATLFTTGIWDELGPVVA